jgi:hypothetical protein
VDDANESAMTKLSIGLMTENQYDVDSPSEPPCSRTELDLVS